jgi:hypothetical protein
MKKIQIPDSYNYVSAFLTFACSFKCSYCINKYNGLYKYKQMKVKDWITGLNRIQARKDLPITLTGGEPTLYKRFYDLVDGIDDTIPVDLLTNGDFDMQEFMLSIPSCRLKRKAKYASIRFSFHPGYSDPFRLMSDVRWLGTRGYSVGIWAVDTGDSIIGKMKKMAKDFGIDFRVKEYLDSTHGNYRYPLAVDGKRKKCLCKPSELLIAPDGRLFRCHYDLYHGVNAYGHLLDGEIGLPQDFLRCDNYGLCNPCDVKGPKFDRFQRKIHCSVTIKEIE